MKKTDRDHAQNNLKFRLSDIVKNGLRKYDVVDGTAPLKTAHVFYTGYTENLGSSNKDILAMAKAIEKLPSYCEFLAKNRNDIAKYYQAE